jgi:DNA mismatch repair protein MutS2
MGAIKSKVSVDRLKLLEKGSKPKQSRPNTRNVTNRAERQVSREMDMRGMAVDEALLELDRFIDAAVLSGVDVITVIHGKGTGALRTAVQSHLRAHKAVRSYRLGTFGEGESGVTIAELK